MAPTVIPGVSCLKSNVYRKPFIQTVLHWFYANITGTWNLGFPPIITTRDMENRKIFNSHLYSHGNQGHEFSSVLTDDEAYAIIEYLKTL